MRAIASLCASSSRRRGAAGLEQRSHVHETLQLQDEVVEFSLCDDGHAAASSSGSASGTSSASAGFDSSITAASTAPAAEIPAST